MRENYRIAGERAPIAVAVGLALLGTAGAVTTSSLWLAASLPQGAVLELGARPPPKERMPQAASGDGRAPKTRAEESVLIAMQQPAIDTEMTGSTPRPPPEQEVERGNSSERASDAIRADLGKRSSVRPSTAEGPVAAARQARAKSPSPSVPRGAAVKGPAQAEDCPPPFTVHFRTGEIHPVEGELEDQVERLRAWLNNHPQATLWVAGYADAAGAAEYNLLLSYRRSRVVAELLQAAGIPGRRLALRAFGEERGATSPPDEQRRVSLYVKGIPQCPQP
jgi:outer membrane protein OmpA-like peptidoglycan-associated protein